MLHAGRRPARGRDAWSCRLRAAGAVILGKTVTTEFAYFTPGKTRNPHDPAHTPGGSSSGSAAAVAAGMVPLAVGTQTNGSVIRPASFCGVVGFKPSFGVISRHGVLRTSRSLDQVGVFARSVRDAALIAQCLAGHDPADARHALTLLAAACRGGGVGAAARSGVRPAALAALGAGRRTTPGPASTSCRRNSAAACQPLRARRGGARHQPRPPDRSCAPRWRSASAANTGAARSRMSARLVELIESGLQVGAVEYQQALARRAAAARRGRSAVRFLRRR